MLHLCANLAQVASIASAAVMEWLAGCMCVIARGGKFTEKEAGEWAGAVISYISLPCSSFRAGDILRSVYLHSKQLLQSLCIQI